MAIKIKKSLYEELIKIKRQKKSVATYLGNKGYSTKFINDITKNWNELEVIGGPASVTTKVKTVKAKVVKATKAKVATKTKAVKKIVKKKVASADLKDDEILAPKATPPPLPPRVQTVVDNTSAPVEKELVLNISEGLEVKAEVQVKHLAHPKFFMASLVKILQSCGAKVTFNAGLNLSNANEKLTGFTLAINEVH